MQPNELLEALSKLKPAKELEKLRQKPLKPCNLTLISESAQTPQAVREKLMRFKPEQGWLCFQDQVEYFRKGESVPDFGIVFYGEVVNTQGQSLHIRENGQGGWVLTTYTENLEGDQYLVENAAFLGEKHFAPAQLFYRVYWQHDEQQGYRQFAARFMRF